MQTDSSIILPSGKVVPLNFHIFTRLKVYRRKIREKRFIIAGVNEFIVRHLDGAHTPGVNQLAGESADTVPGKYNLVMIVEIIPHDRKDRIYKEHRHRTVPSYSEVLETVVPDHDIPRRA